MTFFFDQIKRRNRKASKTHKLYERLRAFRENWESLGGTRGSLRRARKAARNLFPEFVKD